MNDIYIALGFIILAFVGVTLTHLNIMNRKGIFVTLAGLAGAMIFFFFRTKKSEQILKEYENNKKIIQEKEMLISELAKKAQCSEEKLNFALADLHRCKQAYEQEIKNLEQVSNKKSEKIKESGITELFYEVLQ